MSTKDDAQPFVKTTDSGPSTTVRLSNDYWWKLVGAIGAILAAAWFVGGKTVGYEQRLASVESSNAGNIIAIDVMKKDIGELKTQGATNAATLKSVDDNVKSIMGALMKFQPQKP